MSLLTILVVLILFCVAGWFVSTYAPAQPAPIKWILLTVIVVAFVVWILHLTGVFNVGDVRIGK